VLEADISEDTLLTFGGSYDKAKENGTGDGLPRYSTGDDPAAQGAIGGQRAGEVHLAAIGVPGAGRCLQVELV
ncbi:hypothetical protein R0G64_31380, partial [Pseudomonas otitidis]